MDWVKDIAMAGSALYGVEKMLKVFRLWKAANRGEKASMGLTVKNGEYVALIQSLSRMEASRDKEAAAAARAFGRIEKRMDDLHRHVDSKLELVGVRIESLESRLST